jgi:beta-galactosidase
MINIKRILIITISLLLFYGSATADYKPLTKEQISTLVPSSTRHVVDLSGKWEKSYDENVWLPVQLPSSETDKERVTYRKTIKIDDSLIDQYEWHLYFLGINDKVDVYFNNQFIGRYFSSLTPFKVRIPSKMVKNSTVSIKLIVSAAEGTEKRLKEQYPYAKKVYTGVIREVLLIGTPKYWIENISRTKTFNEQTRSWKIDANIAISAGIISNEPEKESRDSLGRVISHGNDISAQIMILDKLSGDTVARSSSQIIEMESERTTNTKFSVSLSNVNLWEPDNPYLYDIYVKITKQGKLIDDYSNEFGFVDYSFFDNKDNKEFAINGKKYSIKGIEYIEDYSGSGTTLTAERFEQDLEMIKTLGANLIRFKYGVPHPYFVHLCNKMGIMLMIELPVFNTPHELLLLDEIQVRLNNLSRLMIDEYERNSCILAWCVSENVLEGNPEVDKFFSKLIKNIRKHSKKMIYKIVWFGTDKLNAKDYDFIGLNPHKDFNSTESIAAEINRIKNLISEDPKPLLLNFGKAIQPNNHNGYSDPYSIEAQAYYILHLINISREQGLAGNIVWSFNDYIMNKPLLLVNNENQYNCSSGIVSRDRSVRLSYKTLQALFTGETEPLLNAGSYTVSTPVIFIIVGIVLSLLLIFLINRFKRFREYLTRSVLRPYNFYADIRDQRIISSVQTVLLGIVISLTLGIFITSILHYYRSSYIAQYVLDIFIPSNGLKEVLFSMIWMPELLMIVSSLIFLLIAYLIASVLWLFSFFIRGKIFFSDTNIISIWSGIPVLMFLPLTIILSRLLVYVPQFAWLAVVLFLLAIIWVVFRVLKSTAVVYDIFPYKVYFTGFALFAIIAFALISLYHFQFGAFYNLKYIIEFMYY